MTYATEPCAIMIIVPEDAQRSTTGEGDSRSLSSQRQIPETAIYPFSIHQHVTSDDNRKYCQASKQDDADEDQYEKHETTPSRSVVISV
jgi:hypothetical protein